MTHDQYKTYCRYGALAHVISDQGGDKAKQNKKVLVFTELEE